MNQELSAKDAPKIALIFALLMVIVTGGLLFKNRMDTERETARMGAQMDREADMPAMTRSIKATDQVEIDPEKQLLVRSNRR